MTSGDTPPVELGHRASFDLLRWSTGPDEQLPGVDDVVRGLYGSVELLGQSTLGDVLGSDSDDYLVAAGTTDSHQWIAVQYQLPLRPRKDPWRVLRALARELHRVAWAEIIDASVWECWRDGRRVREVVLGFGDQPVVRGKLQPFEVGLWDGIAPHPDPEPRFEPVAEDERFDIEELIASQPPENLWVAEDGRRSLVVPSFPMDPETPGPVLPPGRGVGSGFTIVGDGDDFTALPVLNLDTLNLRAVWDDVEDEWGDREALVAAALASWFGLEGSLRTWDWPCRVWVVRE